MKLENSKAIEKCDYRSNTAQPLAGGNSLPDPTKGNRSFDGTAEDPTGGPKTKRLPDEPCGSKAGCGSDD